MIRGTIALSWGEYGGFYVVPGRVVSRISLGRVALTLVREHEIDELLRAQIAQQDHRDAAKRHDDLRRAVACALELKDSVSGSPLISNRQARATLGDAL